MSRIVIVTLIYQHHKPVQLIEVYLFVLRQKHFSLALWNGQLMKFSHIKSLLHIVAK
jgi:hypothetical protein